MKRLAVPVVLTVVFASTGSLIAACGGTGCLHVNQRSDYGCQSAQPTYSNTQFPGTCRDCKNEFAYALWGDYCTTKRRGPAYRLPRYQSSPQCVSSLGHACESGCSTDEGVHSHEQPIQPHPADAPVPAEPQDPTPPQDQPASTESSPDASALDVQRQNLATPSGSIPPEPPSYYSAPRSKDKFRPGPNVAAEVDEQTMPTGASPNSTGPETEEAIKRSIDDAIEKALESNGTPDAQEALDDRSARGRSSFFRLFRLRSR